MPSSAPAGASPTLRHATGTDPHATDAPRSGGGRAAAAPSSSGSARWPRGGTRRERREAPQPQALEAVMGLQVCEAHLDPLPLVARLVEALVFIIRRARHGHLRGHRAASCAPRPWCSTSASVGRHRNRAWWRGRAAYARRAPCRWYGAPFRWAAVLVLSLVPGEVAREKVPSSRLPFSHTGMCGVIPVVDKPAKELARSIGRIGSEPIGLQIEMSLGALDHRLGGRHLVVGACRRCFHVDDHRVLDVDQIVEPVAELYPLVGLGGPGR